MPETWKKEKVRIMMTFRLIVIRARSPNFVYNPLTIYILIITILIRTIFIIIKVINNNNMICLYCINNEYIMNKNNVYYNVYYIMYTKPYYLKYNILYIYNWTLLLLIYTYTVYVYSQLTNTNTIRTLVIYSYKHYMKLKTHKNIYLIIMY